MLFGERPAPDAVRALADDTAAEARTRALAYAWLRANGQSVPKRQLLGVVIEVALDVGLDVLAAFADGGVRFIHHTGRLAFVEGGLPDTGPIVERLFAASRDVIARIGPWDGRRPPPPAQGNIRLTFIVSDGLYFGEGPTATMQQDALAAPVVQHATALLQRVVAVTKG